MRKGSKDFCLYLLLITKFKNFHEYSKGNSVSVDKENKEEKPTKKWGANDFKKFSKIKIFSS